MVDSLADINYLRSHNGRCNLLSALHAGRGLGIWTWQDPSLEDYARLARAAGAGISKIRLTGGEPLVRKILPD